MKKSMLALGLFVALFAVSCSDKKKEEKTPDPVENAKQTNEQKPDMAVPEEDAKFAVFAADGGMMEVQLGNLAQTKSNDVKVKEMGKMIADDHQKANDELKAVAAQHNITLPTTLSNDHQEKYNKMAAKSGKDFDKDYLDAMEEGHKETIKKFEDEAANGKHAQLKQWANDKLPTLRSHLEMVQKMKAVKK